MPEFRTKSECLEYSTKMNLAFYQRDLNGKSEKIGFFNNPIVYPGAEIIIIEKPEKVAGESGKFLDDFVKIFGILSGTLTTFILATKL